MKLGNNLFYGLEGKRQEYVQTFEAVPYVAGVVGLGCFIGFALFSPIQSRLYKEILYSAVIGAAVGYSYSYYYKLEYLKMVDEVYDIMKHRFASNPEMATMKEDEQILKNFGFHKFSDQDHDEEEDEFFKEPGIFDGHPDDDKNEVKERLID